MDSLKATERADAPAPAVTDADVARQSSARLLITASTQQEFETVARHIHRGGPRAQFPFVQTRAAELPVDPEALEGVLYRFLTAAAGGSMLISAVEEMPATVQEPLIDVLAGLQFARRPAAAVRLISGTTVSLFDRIATGTFSERLFYRLNVIHLMVADSTTGSLTL
jgi:DNA-binding NtrC family response regulator